MACRWLVLLFSVIVSVPFWHFVSNYQPGQSYFIVWAYHSTKDVQQGQFPGKHNFSGVHEVSQLIPGLVESSTTPTTVPATNLDTGKSVKRTVMRFACNKLGSLLSKTRHQISCKRRIWYPTRSVSPSIFYLFPIRRQMSWLTLF